MTTVFPTSNLATASQPWGREIQKQLSNIIASTDSEKINNAARDNQLNSSLISISKVANDASSAINGLVGLGSTGSGYTLNASNIVGGTITGVTLQTAASGRRVEISGTSASFYDDSGVYTGELTSFGSSGSSSVFITNVKNGGWGSSNTTRISLGQTSITLGTTVSGGFGSVSVSIGGDGLSVNGMLRGTSLEINNSGGVTAYIAGALSVAGDINANKVISSSGFQSVFSYDNQVGGNARDLYVTSVGNLGTLQSSLKVKEEIQDLELSADSIFSIRPKTFKFKVDVNEFGLENAPTTTGFIAEEMHNAGLNYFVNYGPNYEVEGISYTRYVVALQAAIRNLNERIKILENGA